MHNAKQTDLQLSLEELENINGGQSLVTRDISKNIEERKSPFLPKKGSAPKLKEGDVIYELKEGDVIYE